MKLLLIGLLVLSSFSASALTLSVISYKGDPNRVFGEVSNENIFVTVSNQNKVRVNLDVSTNANHKTILGINASSIVEAVEIVKILKKDNVSAECTLGHLEDGDVKMCRDFLFNF
jgi:hypothetical protein